MSNPEISAVVTVRDGEEDRVSWEFGDRTILELAIQKLYTPAVGISRVYVAGRGLGMVRKKALRHPGVSVLDVDIPLIDAAGDGEPLEGVHALVFAVAGRIHELQERHCDIIVIDPLRPLITVSEIRTAVRSFRLINPESRSRIGVVSVSRVRNHHHPKKVLCMSEGGGLVHFHEAGTRIYQRQQLAGDDYYVIDPAVAVIGRCGEETGWDPANWAAVPIQDNGVRVENPETLALARAIELSSRQVERG